MRRDELIRKLWPDKVLYGCTLLLVSAVVSALHAAAATVVDFGVSGNVPHLLLGWAPSTTIVLSLATALLAFAALARRDVRFAYAGAVVSFLTFGLFGVGPLLALTSAFFFRRARAEDEHRNPIAEHLTRHMWPDKSLAASILFLVASVLSLLWGLALVGGFVAFVDAPARVLGAVALLAGALDAVTARMLYRQRAPALAAVAGVLTVLAGALYVVGPLLGLGGLVLLGLAWKEKEFDPETRRRLHGDAA